MLTAFITWKFMLLFILVVFLEPSVKTTPETSGKRQTVRKTEKVFLWEKHLLFTR